MPGPPTALSAKEQALWLLQKFAPELGVVNVAVAFRMRGGIRWWPLQASLGRLMARHPALRSVFPAVDGIPVRQVLDAADEQAMPMVETIGVTPRTLMSELGRLAARPFDVETEPPVRLTHLIGAGQDVVLLAAQHLAVDRVSINVLLRELVAMYGHFSRSEELPPSLAAEVPPYTERPATEEDRAYWRQRLSARLASGTPPLAIGRDGPQDSFTGAAAIHRLSPSALAGVESLARTLRSTRNIVLLAGYALLLASHGLGHDVVIGLPIDARDASSRDSVGYHINVIALRLELTGASSFGDVAGLVRDAFLADVRHARASIDEVFPGCYESAGPDTDRQPLFRHMFNYAAVEPSALAATLGIELIDVERPTSRLDLELSVADLREQALLRAVYRAGSFGRSDIDTLLSRFDRLICDVAADPWTPIDGQLMRAAADSRPAEPAAVSPPPAAAATGAPVVAGGANGSVPGAGPAGARPPADPGLVDYFLGQWRDLLGRPDVGEDAHFFRHNGTSLLAAKLVARVKQRYGVKLSLREVFRSPTPVQLAQVLGERVKAAGSVTG